MTITEIRDQWTARRNELAKLKASVDGATLCDQVIADLAAIASDTDDELLTLKAAAGESGFSTRQLARMIAERKLIDYGRKNAPRLRRSELPKKPAAPRTSTSENNSSKSTMLSIARSSVVARSRARRSR